VPQYTEPTVIWRLRRSEARAHATIFSSAGQATVAWFFDDTMDRIENYDTVDLALARAEDIRGVLKAVSEVARIFSALGHAVRKVPVRHDMRWLQTARAADLARAFLGHPVIRRPHEKPPPRPFFRRIRQRDRRSHSRRRTGFQRCLQFQQQSIH